MSGSSRGLMQWGWMRIIIFFLLLFRLPRAYEMDRGGLGEIDVVSTSPESVPEDQQISRFPSDESQSEQTFLDSIAPIAPQRGWGWLEKEINRGFPSFFSVKKNVDNLDNLDSEASEVLEIEKFFDKVRKRALTDPSYQTASGFQKILSYVRDKQNLVPILAVNFYDRLKKVDQEMLGFLLRTLKSYQEGYLRDNSFKDEWRQMPVNLFNKLELLIHDRKDKKNVLENLKNIFNEYKKAFEYELAKRNNVESHPEITIDRETSELAAPVIRQAGLPRSGENHQNWLEQTRHLISQEGGEHWDLIASEIKQGLPSFFNVENIDGAANLHWEEFFSKVRKRAAPSFENLMKHYRQVPGSSVPDFYERIQKVDRQINDFLRRTIDYYRGGSLENPLKNIPVQKEELKKQTMDIMNALMSKFDLPHLYNSEEDFKNLEEDLRTILSVYSESFQTQLAIEKNVAPPSRVIMDEESKKADDLLRGERPVGYLNQPHVIGTAAAGLLTGLIFFWWRNHREQTQRQKVLQKFTNDIMSKLPAPVEGWEASQSIPDSADSSVQITYRLELPDDYFILETEEGECSLTRDKFQKHFHDYFSKIKIDDKFCTVDEFKTEVDGTKKTFIRLQLPSLTREKINPLQKSSLMESLTRAREDFLKKVKENAPESQAPKLLSNLKDLLDQNSFFYAKKGMDLLEDELKFSEDEYRETIGKIIDFIEKDVLGSIPCSNINNRLQKLRHSLFKKSDVNIKYVTIKLNDLLWLYSQLNTIAQLIIAPHSASLFMPVVSHDNIQFYRPFSEILNGRGKIKIEVVISFFMKMKEAFTRVDKAKHLTTLSIMRAIENRLNKFLKAENKKRKESIKKSLDDFNSELTELKPEERYKQLVDLRSSVQTANDPVGVLPMEVANLLLLMKDPSSSSALKLIDNIPKFSKGQKKQLKEVIAARQEEKNSTESTSVTVKPERHQSESTDVWSRKFQEIEKQETTSRNCQQKNLGLFYCLTRIIVFSQANLPKEQFSRDHSFLEGLRVLFGHFGYTLPFESSGLHNQFSVFHSRLVDKMKRNAMADIESTELYKTLDSHFKKREIEADWQEERNKMLKVMPMIQKLFHSPNCEENLFSISGAIIVLGQICRDSQEQNLNLFGSNGVAKLSSSQAEACASMRNRLMHQPVSMSRECIKTLQSQESQETAVRAVRG